MLLCSSEWAGMLSPECGKGDQKPTKGTVGPMAVPMVLIERGNEFGQGDETVG